MISKECYVYIQLPNSLEVVTAGKFKWQKSGSQTEVGTFVYGKSYLNNKMAIALDPFQLPLSEIEFQVVINEGVHGPLRDASPDSWGRHVIQKNTLMSEHDPMGYLINSAEDRIGSLSFGFGKAPPAPMRIFNKTIDLTQLIEAAHKLENDLPLEIFEKNLLMIGPSAGGARPKTTIEYKNSLWLAKFPAANDKKNFSKIEYATMKLAKDCGLNVPDIELINVGSNEVFLIQRFDRDFDIKSKNYFKIHFISGLTMLNLDERDYSEWSYLDLADQMRRWIKKPKKDLYELYRRIIFNGLISNTDDHPRNHGFLYTNDGFKLSPVYDLVPKPESGSTRYLAMEFGEQGKVFNLENILSQCDVFDLKKNEALLIFEDMKKKIASWRAFYKSNKISDGDLEFLEGAFSHWEHI